MRQPTEVELLEMDGRRRRLVDQAVDLHRRRGSHGRREYTNQAAFLEAVSRDFTVLLDLQRSRRFCVACGCPIEPSDYGELD